MNGKKSEKNPLIFVARFARASMKIILIVNLLARGPVRIKRDRTNNRHFLYCYDLTKVPTCRWFFKKKHNTFINRDACGAYHTKTLRL